PTATASFHLSLNTAGSSSAPARNVSTIAPTPERNLIQDSSVPSTAEPTTAPKISCATVPTTISDSAVEMRSQIESRPAINARLNQSAASAHTLVMPSPRRFARRSVRDRQTTKTRLAAGHAPTPPPPLGGGRASTTPAGVRAPPPGRRSLMGGRGSVNAPPPLPAASARRDGG